MFCKEVLVYKYVICLQDPYPVVRVANSRPKLSQLLFISVITPASKILVK